jgi:hypothetical protein
MIVRAWAWIIPVMLAGCSAVPLEPSAIPPPTAPAPDPSTSEATTPSAEPTSLQSLLPSRLGDVELHTFAVGQDILERLATELGVPTEQLETAYASEHGARFLQMYAVRRVGTPARSLATGWEAAAYPPDVEDVVVSDQRIGGRPVTVVHAPSAAARLGTFYVLAQDETLFVVQALDSEVAAEAIASLP